MLFKANFYKGCFIFMLIKKIILNKKQLEIELSKLKGFKEGKYELEQYQTPSGLAAEILWWAYMNGDVVSKKVLDAGCGNGIFGIGANLLGAKKIYFLDKDKKMIDLVKENFSKGEYFCCDISDFKFNVDTVIMNPPFGIHDFGADKRFLEVVFGLSSVVYSIHYFKSKEFLEKIAFENNFNLEFKEGNFVLKRTFEFHHQETKVVKVLICRFVRD